MKCPQCNYQWLIKGRTNPQNAAYWVTMVIPFAEFLGITPEECHELLKYKFNKEILYKKNRQGHMEEIVRIKSTTTMTTVEHNEYCSQGRIWASQLGCWLAEPGEILNEQETQQL